MVLRLRIFLSIIILAWSIPTQAEWLYHGLCETSEDPAVTAPSLINVCVKASAGSWLIQKSKNENNVQPDALHRAAGSIGLYVSPWIAFYASGHANVFISRNTQNTTNRDVARDSWLVQVGNNALSRHRVHLGRGRPTYRIDHQQRKEIEYAWGLDSFESPIVDYASYVYDNQMDWTFQGAYGQLVENKYSGKQRLFAAARLMHDIAALEGTRIVLGGFGDGLIRRTASLGMININGKGDETSIEVTRSFSYYPYDPKEFKQNIRISYLSHEQDKTRLKFQYDDSFRKIRLAGFGAVYSIREYANFEVHTGYAKHEDNKSLSHVFMVLHAGAYL